MCLTVKTAKPTVARKDIVCYKVIRKVYDVSEDLLDEEFQVKIGSNYYDAILEKNDEIIMFYVSFFESYFFATNPRLQGVIHKGKDVPIKYITPYRYAQVEISKTYESELQYFERWSFVDVELHSYKSKRKAKISYPNSILVKCVIPKGSRYYVGNFGTAISYASDKLTYIEIIN